MSFDVASIEFDETIEIPITSPKTGDQMLGEDDKPMSVTTYGPGTKPYVAAQAAAQRRLLKRVRARGRNVETSPEEDAEDTATTLAAITVSFNNFTYKGGEPGEAMFKACYADPKMGWLTNQVNSQAGDWANFMKTSPKT